MKQFIKTLRSVVWLLAACFFLQAAMPVHGEETNLIWGVSAMTFGLPCASPPSLDELLSGQTPAVSLDQFYCAGGKDVPATPTECRFAYDATNLFVVFRCAENNLSFPAVAHPADWYSLLNTPADEDAAFPDKVELFFQPDRNRGVYYQFAVTLDGRKFGCERGLPKTAAKDKKISGFTAIVTKRNRQWLVYLKIPWQILDGKPQSFFGVLPVRTRWRNGESSSPVAFDFPERAPVDLFIETHFSDKPGVQIYSNSLCQLLSGTFRWQRPARLTYPDEATRQQIWQMQSALSKPTDAGNFAQRLYLTQRWTDLLALEGFNFRSTGGSIVKEDMMPLTERARVNAALQKNEMTNAWHLLDAYLAQLDLVSRDWFADGSPGDLLKTEWQPVSRLTGWEVKNKILFLHGLAGGHPMDLHLSFPKTGGVRIYGQAEGFFKPADLQPLNVSPTTNSNLIQIADGRVVVSQKPFEIFFYDAKGKKITQLGANDLAFRFGRDGKILAVDVRNNLDSNEVIYGFGERYDRFNENGNVLTLWGMDDWLGNTIGLMNETYKPIALFHSSRGYAVFDNSTYRLRADVGKTDPHQYRLTQFGPIFDFYFWMSSPEKALSSYTALTGKPILPPKWAFEPWMGRTGRGWRGAPGHNAVAEEERVTKRFAELDIPHSAIYSEGEGADSPELNQFMAARGIKVLSWYWPAIGLSQQAQLLPKVKPDELPLLNTGDKNFSRKLGYVDFTNPNALELCRRWWSRRLSLGVAGSMVDFGDRVPEAAIFYNGKRGDEMHNFYAYGYHKTYSEVFREKRGDDFILIGRAAAPGTQKFVAQFAGDHPANFSGLQAVLTGALNLCACGFSTWGSDLGGFLGWPEPAVYLRWTQFACFSPLMRCHGRTPREPWNYGAAAVASYKFYAWVRENLLDYIYDAAMDAHETGVPIMRSLAVAFPNESSLADVKDEYMFGDDLLVAPVVTDSNSRTISFPAGDWTSLWNGTTVSGPAKLTVNVPLQEIPVYLKAGAVVPVQLNPALQFGESMTRGRVNALLVTAPEKTEDVFLPDQQRDKAGVALCPTADGFTVILKNLPEENYLLIRNAAIAKVTINGWPLPKLTGTQFNPQRIGWQNNLDNRQAIIHLPLAQGRLKSFEVKIRCLKTKNFQDAFHK